MRKVLWFLLLALAATTLMWSQSSNVSINGVVPSKTTSITATVQNVTTSATTLAGMQCTNTDSTNWAYVQAFNALAANVTVGATTAVQSWGLPPGGGSVGPPYPLRFTTAMSVAATTTATGSTGADATEVNCNWGTRP